MRQELLQSSLLVALFVWPILTPAAPPEWALDVKPVRCIEAVSSVEIHGPNLAVREWVLVAPRVPELPAQRQVTTRMSPSAQAATDHSPLTRGLLVARLPGSTAAAQKKATLTVQYEATLMSRRLVARRGEGHRRLEGGGAAGERVVAPVRSREDHFVKMW